MKFDPSLSACILPVDQGPQQRPDNLDLTEKKEKGNIGKNVLKDRRRAAHPAKVR